MPFYDAQAYLGPLETQSLDRP